MSVRPPIPDPSRVQPPAPARRPTVRRGPEGGRLPVPRHRERGDNLRWPGAVATAAVVLGAAVRLEQFGSRRSLWLDEALVANNVVTRDFAGLLKPLSGEQGAPIGWLWAQRLAVIVLGNNEYALRLVPLLAGVAALVLIHRLAHRVAGPVPAAVAVWLLALAPAAVRYSVEVKQYSSDLCVALGLVVLALRCRREGGRLDGRTTGWWALAGAVAVWCAHPAVLVLAASAAMLWVDALVRRDRRDVRRVVTASVPWAASFLAVWLVSLRRLGHDPFLRNYWAAGLAPRPLRTATYLPWLGQVLLHLLGEPGHLGVPHLAGAVAVAGAALALWRRPFPAVLLLSALPLGLLAATVGGFPMRGRIALWLLPVALVSIATLVGVVGRARPRRPVLRWASVAAVVGVLGAVAGPPAVDVMTLARDPSVWSDVRPLLQQIHRRAGDGDLVWVHEPDAAAAAYYATSTGVIPTHVLHDATRAGDCPGEPDLAGAAAGHRVWFVYGYHLSTAPPGEQAALRERLRAVAHLAAEVRRPEATAWLVDFGAAPDVAGAADGLACVAVTAAPDIPGTGLTRGPLGTGGPA